MKEKQFKVKELRNKLRMTQREFAQEVGVTIQSVQNWENESKRPSYRSIKIMEKRFEVKLDY